MFQKEFHKVQQEEMQSRAHENSAMQQYMLGAIQLESKWQKGIWWSWWAQSSTRASTMSLPERRLLVGGCVFLLFLFSSHEAQTWSILSSSGLLSTKDTCAYWEESNKGWLRIWNTSHMRKVAWLFSLESEYSWSILWMCINSWWKDAEKMYPGSFLRFPVTLSEAMGTSWNTGGPLWTSLTLFLPWGWLNVGTGCPEKLLKLHLWKHAKPIWTWSWAIESRWPYLSRTGNSLFTTQ